MGMVQRDKETNTHDYLRYDSHHPDHVKNNIPFTLAKKIIVFLLLTFGQYALR